jgi:hypothetical protein
MWAHCRTPMDEFSPNVKRASILSPYVSKTRFESQSDGRRSRACPAHDAEQLHRARRRPVGPRDSVTRESRRKSLESLETDSEMARLGCGLSALPTATPWAPPRRRNPMSRSREPPTSHPFSCLARNAFAQPALASWRPRATASASASTGLVMTEPEPI